MPELSAKGAHFSDLVLEFDNGFFELKHKTRRKSLYGCRELPFCDTVRRDVTCPEQSWCS